MTTKVTESHHNYKGYDIRLRAVIGNGFWFIISKKVPNENSPGGIRNVNLTRKGFAFILPDILLDKAKEYIDKHEDNLIKNLNKQKWMQQ